jgi:hypothetical protein
MREYGGGSDKPIWTFRLLILSFGSPRGRCRSLKGQQSRYIGVDKADSPSSYCKTVCFGAFLLSIQQVGSTFLRWRAVCKPISPSVSFDSSNTLRTPIRQCLRCQLPNFRQQHLNGFISLASHRPAAFHVVVRGKTELRHISEPAELCAPFPIRRSLRRISTRPHLFDESCRPFNTHSSSTRPHIFVPSKENAAAASVINSRRRL